MKTLYLLRHAKSSWTDPGLDDGDRPLAPRGRRAAAKLAAYVRRQGIAPDLVLSSTARRATETLGLLWDALSQPEARLEPELYAASAASLLARVRAVPDGVSSLLVVGHNPGLHALALDLAGTGDRTLLDRLHEKLPTGALVTLALSAGGWSDTATGSCELRGLVVPRDLR